MLWQVLFQFSILVEKIFKFRFFKHSHSEIQTYSFLIGLIEYVLYLFDLYK